MKKRFGIDIDGTVTCPSSLIPHLNKAFNRSLVLDDLTEYDLTKALPDVNPQAFAQWFDQEEGTIYAASPLADHAALILDEWKKEHELYFISARHSRHLELTTNWFDEQGIDYDHIELIGSHDKVSTAKKYDVDLFFEDKHDNAVMIHEELNIPVILFDTPYNRDPVPNGVIRVYSWMEAKEWVNNWLHSVVK